MKALIIEDNAAQAEFTRKGMARLGFECRVAADGQIGLDALFADDYDSGIGISANDLPRIFNRHFRADASRHERGFGLGLALVKSIVDGCGGDIACASEPGRGTTFTVRLPAAAVVV